MNNPTTQMFSRTSRPTGTEYASAIERTRRNDTGGKVIAFVVCVVVMAITYLCCWSAS